MAPTLPLLLAACAPRPLPIEVGAVPDDAAAVAIVGETAGGGPEVEAVAAAIAAEVLEGRVGVVVLVGDPVSRPTRREWASVTALWEPAAAAGALVRPLVGAAVAGDDPRLAGLGEAFPGARAFDFVDAAGMRLVFADTSGDPVRTAEQVYWLPRAMGDEAPKLLFLPDGPARDKVGRAAQDYTPASAPTLASFTPGPASSCAFPGGTWGGAEITVGPGTWWTVELGPEVHLSDRGAEPHHWRWDPRNGWRTLP